MNKISLVDSISELKDERMINKSIIINILESIFKTELDRKFKNSDIFDIILNPDNGDIEIWQNKTVVADGSVQDVLSQISLSDVQRIEPDFEIGEVFSEEFKLEDLGRRSILNIKQSLMNRLREMANINIVDKFGDMIGYLYSGEVSFIKGNFVILTDQDGIELLLSKEDQIPGDRFHIGQSVKTVIKSASIINGKPVIKVTRSNSDFLSALLQSEISEIMDGAINIKSVVRKAGVRSKVVLESFDDRIDPVGICVGVKGSRIKPINRELNGEIIDIIDFSENKKLFITRCLKINPSSKLEILDGVVNVYLNTGDDIGRVMGKFSSNIDLASELVGSKIAIFSGDSPIEEDVDLVEFSDEIDNWIIEQIINSGYKTAKSVMAESPEYISRVTDLELETVLYVFDILDSEFKK